MGDTEMIDCASIFNTGITLTAGLSKTRLIVGCSFFAKSIHYQNIVVQKQLVSYVWESQ